MSLTDYRIRCLIEATKNESAIQAMRELLQHRTIAREILKFERDPVAKSFDGIVRMVHQVHDKKVTPAPRRKQGRNQKPNPAKEHSAQVESFRHSVYGATTQVEERRRQ